MSAAITPTTRSEMGHDPDREAPFFFMKAPDTLVTDGRFPYPPATQDVHHEVELVVALGKGGRDSRSGRHRPASTATP